MVPEAMTSGTLSAPPFPPAAPDPRGPCLVLGKIGPRGNQLIIQAGELRRQGAAVLGRSCEIVILADIA